MPSREHDFWTNGNKYEELAKIFERNIENIHPAFVTSKRMCSCLKYCSTCEWAVTNVNYKEYRGPNII